MSFGRLKRRDFITLLGGAAAAWPLAALGQQAERVRLVGVLMNLAAGDSESTIRLATFRQALQLLGWTEGRNLRIESRFGASDAEQSRKYAAELLALAPDVIVTNATVTLSAVLQATRSVPVVFTLVADPVGGGFIRSLARPGGNVTGFTNFEYGISAKWLELLKQVVPRMTSAMVLRDPNVASAIGQWGALQSVAPAFGLELIPIDVRDPKDIERTVTSYVQGPNTGLILLPGGVMAELGRRNLIIGLADRLHMPAIYPYRYYVTDGGLICYGPDTIEPFRQAAGYVDRILRGEKPADLPVQAPTKYEMVINLKTAKALGVTVPPSLLATADEVIE
jgi:putative tryptophan/tyrosine transport system substrate-binding protein